MTNRMASLINLIIIGFLVLSVIILLNFLQNYRWNKNYLKAISVGENGIELEVVNHKEEVRMFKASLENCRLKIPELIFCSRYRRIFALQIDIKSGGKFMTVHNQHEVGKWDLDLFKEVYLSYCNFKSVSISISSIEGTSI